MSSGIIYTLLLTFLLWWLPLVGQVIAGYFGGRKAGTRYRGVLTALTAAVIILLLTAVISFICENAISAAISQLASEMNEKIYLNMPAPVQFFIFYVTGGLNLMREVLGFNLYAFLTVIVLSGFAGGLTSENMPLENTIGKDGIRVRSFFRRRPREIVTREYHPEEFENEKEPEKPRKVFPVVEEVPAESEVVTAPLKKYTYAQPKILCSHSALRSDSIHHACEHNNNASQHSRTKFRSLNRFKDAKSSQAEEPEDKEFEDRMLGRHSSLALEDENKVFPSKTFFNNRKRIFEPRKPVPSQMNFGIVERALRNYADKNRCQKDAGAENLSDEDKGYYRRNYRYL